MAPQGKFQLLTRLGFAARGLLYITIGLLVLGTGRTEDPGGALTYLGSGFGKWLLVLLAAGLLAYGLWRLADAFVGFESGGGDKKAMGKRAAAGFSGAVHLLLAYQAVHLLQGSGSGGGDKTQENAATVLELPGGPVLLTIIALALLAAGASQLITAAKCGFLKKLDDGAAAKPCVKWLGRGGYAARGILFLLVGFFLLRGALDSDPSEARGLERAIDWLSSPVDLLVAAGLFLFGVFSLVEARYRRIHRPPVEHMRQQVESAIR